MFVVIVSSVSIDTTLRRPHTWSRCHNGLRRSHTQQRSHHRAKRTLNARRIEYGKKWAAVSISKRIVVAVDFANANIVLFLFLSVVDVLTFTLWWRLEQEIFCFFNTTDAMQPRTLNQNLVENERNDIEMERHGRTQHKNELFAIYAKRKKFKYISIVINLGITIANYKPINRRLHFMSEQFGRRPREGTNIHLFASLFSHRALCSFFFRFG